MITETLSTTGLGSALLLAAGLGVVVWLLVTDRRAR